MVVVILGGGGFGGGGRGANMWLLNVRVAVGQHPPDFDHPGNPNRKSPDDRGD